MAEARIKKIVRQNEVRRIFIIIVACYNQEEEQPAGEVSQAKLGC
jgi:hypothetical protein